MSLLDSGRSPAPIYSLCAALKLWRLRCVTRTTTLWCNCLRVTFRALGASKSWLWMLSATGFRPEMPQAFSIANALPCSCQRITRLRLRCFLRRDSEVLRGLHLAYPRGASPRRGGRPDASQSDYAAVPGFPQERNCVCCRFFLTGPAFLPGLIAHFNTVSEKVHRQSDRYSAVQDKLSDLEDQLREAERGPA